MESEKTCISCEDLHFGETAAEIFCALCGLIIRNEPAFVTNIFGIDKHFCTERCFKKFEIFREAD